MNLADRLYSLGQLDRMSYTQSAVQRLDARVKVLATLFFILAVVSYPVGDPFGHVPLAFFPVIMATAGGIPFSFLLRKALIVSPLAVGVGIANPFLNQETALVIAGIPLSSGWLSFFSIMLKFFLSTSAALLLVATTSFPGVCRALTQLKCPVFFVSQLMFLYRYLFVLAEEALRLVRAWDLRAAACRKMGIKIFIRLAGMLLIRTLERAERIHRAMLSRAFRGDIPMLGGKRLTYTDALFLVFTSGTLILFRFFPVTQEIGLATQKYIS